MRVEDTSVNGDVEQFVTLASALAERLLLDRVLGNTYAHSHSSSRDYYDVLGYPENITLDNYRSMFERDGMADRIVEFPAKETWRDFPSILDGDNKDAVDRTPFTDAVKAFVQKTNLYHYCKRLDILSRLGRFGILVIGVRGYPNQEALIKPGSVSLDDILYLRPYGEDSVDIISFDTDPGSPRYGLPVIYEITSTLPTGVKKVRVHWSRVLHVSDSFLENDVYGRPALQRVYNYILDILKVVGGSSEATWKLMRKGFVLNIDPAARLSPSEEAALEQQFDEYDHGLRRYLQTRGMTVQDLGSEVVDIGPVFDTIVSLIAAATGIPKRILLGSERGELASSQDAQHWSGQVAERRQDFAETVVLRPLIDRMIEWGVLPEPSSGEYTIVWPPLYEPTDKETAEVADTWANAIAKITQYTGELPISVKEFRRQFTPFVSELEESTSINPEIGTNPNSQLPPAEAGSL